MLALLAKSPGAELQSNWFHQTQTKCSCEKIVPFGHKKSKVLFKAQMWKT